LKSAPGRHDPQEEGRAEGQRRGFSTKISTPVAGPPRRLPEDRRQQDPWTCAASTIPTALAEFEVAQSGEKPPVHNATY